MSEVVPCVLSGLSEVVLVVDVLFCLPLLYEVALVLCLDCLKLSLCVVCGLSEVVPVLSQKLFVCS